MLLNNTEIETLTIPVEPEKENLTKVQVDPITIEKLQNIYGSFYSTSMKQNQEIILDYGAHPILQGFVDAYKNHRPVMISPDIIWILIIQVIFTSH